MALGITSMKSHCTDQEWQARVDLAACFGALDYGINRAGYVIHSAIHAARPEIACVIHRRHR